MGQILISHCTVGSYYKKQFFLELISISPMLTFKHLHEYF